MEKESCPNCGTIISGNFCSNCGQKTDLPRLTMKDIVGDFLSSVFNVGSPFPRTLKGMFTRPHLVVSEYINGKRKMYYAPIRYLVLCLFINLLFGEIVGFDPIENQKSINQHSMDEQAKIGYEAGKYLAKYLNLFLFILPFSIALFSKLFFWKTSYNFTERIVMGFYLSAQFTIISLLPILLTLIHPALFYTTWLLTLLFFSFFFYKTFLKKSKIRAFLKSILASIFSIVGYIYLAYTIAYFIVVNLK